METRCARSSLRLLVVSLTMLLAATAAAAVRQDDEEPRTDTPPLLRAFTARGIGPASMSGRVTDLAVDPKRSATFYVATATGGLWKTTNNATTWAPIFDNENVSSIGAVAVAPSDP